MAKQVITITITDCESPDNKTGLDCHFELQGEDVPGAFSFLMAGTLGQKFKSIMDVTAEYAQVQAERKARSAISLTRSIH